MDDALYSELLSDAEETLTAEGLLMLYEVSWRLHALAPDLEPAAQNELFKFVYAALRAKYQLAQVWVDWPPRRIVGRADDLEPDFELDSNDQSITRIMSLIPVEDVTHWQ